MAKSARNVYTAHERAERKARVTARIRRRQVRRAGTRQAVVALAVREG